MGRSWVGREAEDSLRGRGLDLRESDPTPYRATPGRSRGTGSDLDVGAFRVRGYRVGHVRLKGSRVLGPRRRKDLDGLYLYEEWFRLLFLLFWDLDRFWESPGDLDLVLSVPDGKFR